MVRYIGFHAPDVQLRLIASNPETVEQPRQDHPDVEVVKANYFDQASLDVAIVGMPARQGPTSRFGSRSQVAARARRPCASCHTLVLNSFSLCDLLLHQFTDFVQVACIL